MSRVVIIGGGVIGLCSAYYLAQSGWKVTVVDQGSMEDSCSYGNAGMIVPSYFTPLAGPGVIRKSLPWLLRKDSPVSLKPEEVKDWKWMFRFFLHANKRHARYSRIPLRDLSLYSKAHFLTLCNDRDFQVEQKGVMMLSATSSGYKKECQLAKQAEQLGLEVDCLSTAAAQDLQGGMAMDIQGAVHYRCDAHVDPRSFMKGLIHALEGMGVGLVRNAGLKEMHTSGKSVKSILLTSGHYLTADAFVLSAGSWSGQLAKLLGLSLPLMPGRGYSFMEAQKPVLRIPVLLSESKVAITPMGDATRIAGGMELGAMGLPLQEQRVQGMIQSLRSYFPEWNVSMPALDQMWSGYRPCSPDGLPYIGYSKRSDNLVLATGHGMMGLSMGPGTGALVASLLNKQECPVDITRFSPNRFA